MNYGAHTLDKLFYMTGLRVENVTAHGNNFLSDDTIEATAPMLLSLSDGSSATFTYCGCHVPGQYDTYFYFTDGVAKLQSCKVLWIAKGANPFEQIEIPGEDDILGEQLEEFVNMIEGKENSLVTPSYGREVIDVLEKAFLQMN